ncbi:MAG: sugar phosphate isomerase/epimerase [Candidatus Eisenbacteria sp.]|nr:sugar phosphate isomerase/epimerase [Candidatus Eisenbacteria bacterium]
MDLSFSTLGCPGWTLRQVVEAARLYGFDGVELRGIEGELDIRGLPDFTPGRIAQSRAVFEDAGIDIVSVDSSARLLHGETEMTRAHIEEASDYIALANGLGAPLVRVFGGYLPQGLMPADGARQLAANLSRLADRAKEMGVSIALETHEGFLTGKAVSEVMSLVDHEAVGVVWDISNCFWTGEPLEESAKWLAPYLSLVHVKDSVLRDGKAKLTLIGEGDVPIKKALRTLADMGYDGYLSYEWEKVWQPDLPEAQAAFPQYVEKMREYIDELR